MACGDQGALPPESSGSTNISSGGPCQHQCLSCHDQYRQLSWGEQASKHFLLSPKPTAGKEDSKTGEAPPPSSNPPAQQKPQRQPSLTPPHPCHTRQELGAKGVIYFSTLPNVQKLENKALPPPTNQSRASIAKGQGMNAAAAGAPVPSGFPLQSWCCHLGLHGLL